MAEVSWISGMWASSVRRVAGRWSRGLCKMRRTWAAPRLMGEDGENRGAVLVGKASAGGGRSTPGGRRSNPRGGDRFVGPHRTASPDRVLGRADQARDGSPARASSAGDLLRAPAVSTRGAAPRRKARPPRRATARRRKPQARSRGLQDEALHRGPPWPRPRAASTTSRPPRADDASPGASSARDRGPQ